MFIIKYLITLLSTIYTFNNVNAGFEEITDPLVNSLSTAWKNAQIGLMALCGVILVTLCVRIWKSEKFDILNIIGVFTLILMISNSESIVRLFANIF